MDIAVTVSGFFGLMATFVASALWATRPPAGMDGRGGEAGQSGATSQG